MSAKSFFVSDLHLFSRRSQAGLHDQAIRIAAEGAQSFILGGDIFDFRWSTLGSVEATVNAAVVWLDNLVSSHSECEFHFVLGNHDFHQAFITRLADLSNERENLSWHRYYMRLGGNMFLHGDVADRPMNHQTLETRRSRSLDEDCRGTAANALYDLAVAARLHRLASAVVHKKPTIARRIKLYLDDIGHGPENGLRHVYFGHTHSPMHGFEFDGLTFHNGGAPIKGLDFRIVPVELSP